MIETAQAWLNTFLDQRNLSMPDGRPLYAYLCRTDEFEALGSLLLNDKMAMTFYMAESLHFSWPILDRLFVLFCAEWWRRNYASGPWKWQPIFEALNWPEIDYAMRSRFVEQGLRYWKRPLLRKGDDRGFLLTIACEGGLPINLIRNDTGYLRAFLRAVLRDYATYSASGVNAADLAGIHLDYLPVTLRQPMVQELAGILIEKIWELQNQLPQGSKPVEELDRLTPNWRQQLPMVMEDNVANDLVSALLLQAKKIRPGPRLRIVRRLVRIGNNWQLQAELQLPDTINRNRLIDEIGTSTSLGERLELLLSWGEKVVRVASLLQHADAYNVYPLDRRHLQIRENVEAEINCLVYEKGKQVGQLPLRGGNSLTSELPLIFVDREGGGQDLDFQGQGSISSRFSEVYVLAHVKPAEGCSNGDENNCELITDRIRIFEREASLCKLSGEFTINLDENVACTIRTHQQEELEAEYRLEGKRNYLIEAKWPVFLGMPRVKRVYENISANYVRPEELYWSKPTGKRNWQKVTETPPRGLVDFRHVRNGECLFSGRVIVLPEGSEIKLEPSDRGNEGTIVLRKLHASHVLWQEEGLAVKKSVEDDSVFLQCFADISMVGKINLKLGWPDGCGCELAIPFPAEGGRFVDSDGKIVSPTQSLSLDDLYGYSAIAVSLRGNQHFYIQGKLQAGDVDAEMHRTLDFRVSLPALTGSVSIYELPLYELYHKLLQLFNHSSDKDAFVTLELIRHGSTEAKVQIRQFSAALKFDADSNKLYIEPKTEEMVAYLNQEAVELLPLKDPTAMSQWLQMHDDETPCWPVSHEILARGPWLALTSKGVRRRCRPRLVPPLSQANSPLVADAGLCEIISEPDYEMRIQAMHNLYNQMEENLNHQQWPVLFSYVERFAAVHPNCLDWLTVAVEHPRILIGLLLIGGTNIFEIVYEWQEYLPFKWWMLPMKDWQAVIHAQLEPFESDANTYQILVGEIKRSLQKFNERDSAFGIILECLLSKALQTNSPTSVLNQVKAWGVDKSWRQLEGYPLMELRREKAESYWPTGMDRDEWSELVAPEHRFALRWLNSSHNYQRAILDAPLAAAYFSVVGKYPQKSWRSFLTAFRDFHPDWFDTAFRAVQAILLTQFEVMHPDNELTPLGV